ncbi:hypothetical protein [Rhizohabitans arisaemae]|uniref:hypothetical protein n=1 Tax=Rhizohabitans arisaemae TaxID=2720610 RepID=UPI0024B070B9|nr:hypothetical protein [Rhizohabitans arisaemae]
MPGDGLTFEGRRHIAAGPAEGLGRRLGRPASTLLEQGWSSGSRAPAVFRALQRGGIAVVGTPLPITGAGMNKISQRRDGRRGDPFGQLRTA